MITYEERLVQFWLLMEEQPLTPPAVMLYLYLLHQHELNGRPKFMDIKNTNLVSAINISEHTLIDARKALSKRGLITFDAGIRKAKPPRYYCNLYCKNFSIKFCKNMLYCKNFSIKFSKKNEPNGLDNKELTPTDEVKNEKKTSKKDEKNDFPPHTYTSLNNNINNIINNNINLNNNINKKEKVCKKKKESPTDSIFTEKQLEQPKPKPRKAAEFVPPTLEDVIEYFKKQDAPSRIENWEEEAKIFFNHHDSLGWRTAKGAIIHKWDSRANLWILDKEKDGKNKRTAESVQSGSRGNKKSKVEPGCGLIE